MLHPRTTDGMWMMMTMTMPERLGRAIKICFALGSVGIVVVVVCIRSGCTGSCVDE